MQLCPEDAEDYIEYLLQIDRLDEAAVKLAEIVNCDTFVSKHGKPKHQVIFKFCTVHIFAIMKYEFLVCDSLSKIQFYDV